MSWFSSFFGRNGNDDEQQQQQQQQEQQAEGSVAERQPTAEELRRRRLAMLDNTAGNSPAGTASPTATPSSSRPNRDQMDVCESADGRVTSTPTTPAAIPSATCRSPVAQTPPTVPGFSPPTTSARASAPPGGAATATTSTTTTTTTSNVGSPSARASLVSAVPTTPSPEPSRPLSSNTMLVPNLAGSDESMGGLSPSSPSKNLSPEELQARYISSLIKNTLGITLTAGGTSPGDSSLVYLPGLADELSHDGLPLEPTEGLLDRIMFERLAFETARMPNIDYLINTYESAEQRKRRIKKDKTTALQLVNALQALAVSYTGLVLSDPTLFSETPVFTREQYMEQFMSKLCADQLPRTFFADLVARYEKDNPEAIFVPMFLSIRANLQSRTIVQSFLPHVRAFVTLMSYPSLAMLAARMPIWLPKSKSNGRVVESETYLGPFFSIASAPDSMAVVDQIFGTIDLTSRSSVENTLLSLRKSIEMLNGCLYEAMFAVYKASRDEGRELLLSWVAEAIEGNTARSRMQINRAVVSSEGFALNLGSVMCLFCKPFLDPKSTKFLSLIDPTYISVGKRLNTEGETKLVATSDQLASWVDIRNQSRIDEFRRKQAALQASAIDERALIAKENYGFTTECFFLTMRAYNVGLMASFSRFERFLRSFHDLHTQYEELLAQRPQWQGTPGALEAQSRLMQQEQELKVMKKLRLAIESQLLDPKMLSGAAQFYNFAAAWMVRLVDPEDKGLPLASPSMEFSCLPEFCVEDIAMFIINCHRFYADFREIASSLLNGEMLNFAVLLMGSPSHINSPYLRAKLAEIILGFIPQRGEIPPWVYAVFTRDARVVKFLIPAILNLYCDVERTGSHTQFYDKFNIRYQLQQILRFLWDIKPHRETFVRESNNTQVFQRFGDNVLNDGIFLLDEALLKLEEIHKLELAMANQAEWNAQPPEILEEKRKTYAGAERTVKSYLHLGNSIVSLMHYLTREIKEPFMDEALVSRIANMLNCYLDALAGPRVERLQVRKARDYNWNPQMLLEQLSDIYRFLAHPRFYEAVAKDQRYYKHELFVKAADILAEREWRSRDLIAQFREFAANVQQCAIAESEAAAAEEVPEEFLDALLYEMMLDPVRLPSGQIVDRATITRHLFTDPTDPFTRLPLSETDLVPEVELKARIDEFLSRRRAK